MSLASPHAQTAKTAIPVPAVELSDLVRYAGASGDFNAIHYDPVAASAAGLPGPIVHGMLSAGLIASALEADGTAKIKGEIAFSFHRPVPAGQELELRLVSDTESTHAELTLPGGEKALVSAEVRHDGNGPSIMDSEDRVALEPIYEWAAELGASRFFADAVRAQGPRPVVGDLVPLTFPVSALRWSPAPASAVKRLGFDYRRMLAVGTTFQFVGPRIAVGEALLVTEAHANRSEREHPVRGLMRFADVVLDFHDEGGVHRLRIVNRFIEIQKR